MDLRTFFTNTLDKLLEQEGFDKISFDVYPNRYKALYRYTHRDKKGNPVLPASVIEIIGIPVGSLIACYGNILESPFTSPSEPVRTKIQLGGRMKDILRKFEVHFIYRLKDFLSPGFSILPREIIYQLVENLTVEDLVSLSLVNRAWNKILEDDYIWKRVYANLFGEFPNIDMDESDGRAMCIWKDLVRKEYLNRKKMKEDMEFAQDLSRRCLPAPTLYLALPPPLAIPLPPIPGAPIPLPGPPDLWNDGVRPHNRHWDELGLPSYDRSKLYHY